MNRATPATGWVRNPDGTLGWTWNPITGCLNHVNGLCKGGGFPCYAYKLAHGRLKPLYLANGLVACDYDGGEEGSDAGLKAAFADPFYPRFWEERLLELPNNVIAGKERGISVCDMSDLFGIGIPESWTRQIIERIKGWPEFRFYLLTKQPQNLIRFSPFPDNCWVGVTATNSILYATAAYWLKEIEAKVKFISFEPLLERIAPKAWPWQLFPEGNPKGICNWLIIGAQTKPYKPPEIAWVREIVEAADKAGIKVFLKDNLKPLFAPNYETEHRWAYKLQRRLDALVMDIRQELPEIK